MDFRLYGRSYHPVLRHAEDLRNLCELDEGLWVATSAPISSFRMDPMLLTLLDSDKDSRVKCGELIEAIRWLLDVLETPSGINEARESLKQDELSETHPDAKDIREFLTRLQPGGQELSLDAIRNTRKTLEARPVSESGVVLPDATEEEDLKGFMGTLVSTLGGVDHPSGAKGLDKGTLDRFFKLRAERLTWLDQVADQDELGRSRILPLGDDTRAATQALQAIQGPMDHYFHLCDAVDLDPESKARIWPGIPENTPWDNPDALQTAMRTAPLAQPNPERVFRFDEQVNPAWERELHTFRQDVMVPLLDRTDEVLTRKMWQTLCDRLKPYADWSGTEPAAELKGLSTEDLRLWEEPAWRPRIEALMNHQKETAIDLDQVRKAEKLALYQGHLLKFANNFAAFPFLYDAEKRAGFEMGTLIMDARRFTLSIQVPNRAEYIKNIKDGTMFIMIVELVDTHRKLKMDIAVPATRGGQGNLKVGKHGIFEHVDGTQWFATVVHITDNPISLGEAMLEPFKRLGSAVTRKVESITKAAEKKLDETGSNAVEQIQQTPAAAQTQAGGGILAGGGIAIAAMGSSLAFITKIFSELQFAGIMKGLGGAVLAVLIPSTIIAWMRLQKRDLSVLLEGADWAINSRMRLTVGQCRTFTRKPRFPKGSTLRQDWVWWVWRIGVLAALTAATVRVLIQVCNNW